MRRSGSASYPGPPTGPLSTSPDSAADSSTTPDLGGRGGEEGRGEGRGRREREEGEEEKAGGPAVERHAATRRDHASAAPGRAQHPFQGSYADESSTWPKFNVIPGTRLIPHKPRHGRSLTTFPGRGSSHISLDMAEV